MRAAVVVFPGSNCDTDVVTGLQTVLGIPVDRLWHKQTDVEVNYDLIVLPGGFSYGDYLRCGAIAAHSPIMTEVKRHAERGGYLLGICNGFQILTEAGLLPGGLRGNAGLQFICREVVLQVANRNSPFTCALPNADLTLPIAHHDGNYQIDDDGLKRLQDNDQIALTYATPVNGSVANIAGVLSANKRVLGLMPHPERAVDQAVGNTDGREIFLSLQTTIGA
jgi:phosphoribosylformylglycinamidine synthase